MWYGGQEDLTTERVKLAGIGKTRDRRTSCKGVKFSFTMIQETATDLFCSNGEIGVFKGTRC